MIGAVRNMSPIAWVTMIIVGLALFVAIAFGREYLRNMDIAAELARLQEENAALEGGRLESVSLIGQLSTRTYVEEGSRTKLNLAKPGETMYIVQDGAGDQVAPAVAVDPATDEALSNPAKWLYYFFNRDTSSQL